MRLQFVGCGDAFGSGGRFNTCFRVECSQGQFLIDCGATSLVALRKLGIDLNAIRTIFISHLHGDHFGGVPFFILDAQLYSRRTTPLTLVGPPGFQARLTQAMEVFFPGSTGITRKFEFEILEIEPGGSRLVNGVEFSAFEVQHACAAPPLALRFTCDGRTIAYSGDTEWTDALIAAGHEADLFIVEALFFEKAIRHHLDYATYRANSGRIGAKRTILTHMSPDMLAHLGDVMEETAEDGKIVEI